MPRPNPNSLKVPWDNLDPCPCYSRENFGNCCAQPNKLPLFKLASLTPPGQITNHSHQKCYLNFTKNCCSKISGEHYISKNILEIYAGLTISGMPWQKPGVIEPYNANNLTANVLCRRHNTALPPLDAAAGHFFREIFKATQHAQKRSVSNRSKNFLVSGDAIELWSLKAMLGLRHAKIARTAGATTAGTYHFSNATTHKVFLGSGFEKPLGLYIGEQAGGLADDQLGLAPLFDKETHDLFGLIVKASGILFQFIFEKPRLNIDHLHSKFPFYRPGVIDLNGRKRNSRILITWKSQTIQVRQVEIKIGQRQSSGH